MNRTTLLFLFMSAVAPVLSMLPCSKCDENCNRTAIERWRNVLSDVERSIITNKTINKLMAPWKYVENVNDTRLPRIIWTAQCQHERCLTNQPLRVLPLSYNIKVYYQVRCQNLRHYKLVPDTFKVTVGCVCAHFILPK